MQITAETIQDQIPYYLTQKSKENLIKALEEFPKSTNYYISNFADDFLQGDGWTALELINFSNGERKAVKGILLTNSCDISAENSRALPINLSFAPIIKLEGYSVQLKKAGLEDSKINDKINAIKEQKVSSLYYLPAGKELGTDYIALLNDIHTLPFSAFQGQSDRRKLFTLSQVGFYLFLLKLSVHFCRFHEEVDRSVS